MPDNAPSSSLDGWVKSPFSGAGLTYDCYEKGAGPGVVLIPEIPGITPEVLGLADHLVGEGFTVVIPSPFGTTGKAESNAYTLGVVARVCVSAEFRAFAVDAKRPITAYLRAVAADLATRTPGRGVGVIGMCFTGGFALATAIEPSVLAPVMSQPSTPLPLSASRRRDPGLSRDELAQVVERTRTDGLCVLGLRFSGDRLAPKERFATLREHLGDAFEVIELDSGSCNSGGFAKTAHSVLTRDLRDTPGHPALEARTRTVTFLRQHLDPTP
ncbi:dienelactone hydrolase family protein [Kribbella sp. CA-294648]|uniref:dienelactone hydrolase family protein n=1 Tax=Kribbella sp. CA-294648 TaxID=3239948 RepID=UPI003D89FC3A